MHFNQNIQNSTFRHLIYCSVLCYICYSVLSNTQINKYFNVKMTIITHICLWQTMHTHSNVWVENSRHALHTRSRQERHWAPRFIIFPNSMRHREQDSFDSMLGRSREPHVFSAPLRRIFCSSLRSRL